MSAAGPLLRQVPVAWRTMTHDKIRTLTALAGIWFVITFMYLQLGFLGATENTALALPVRDLAEDQPESGLQLARPGWCDGGRWSHVSPRHPEK